jgi:hypothetical protein
LAVTVAALGADRLTDEHRAGRPAVALDERDVVDHHARQCRDGVVVEDAAEALAVVDRRVDGLAQGNDQLLVVSRP